MLRDITPSQPLRHILSERVAARILAGRPAYKRRRAVADVRLQLRLMRSFATARSEREGAPS